MTRNRRAGAPTRPGVTARFVDGPRAGDTRFAAVDGDGNPPATMRVPDGSNQPGAMVSYERVDLGDVEPGGTARYRVVDDVALTDGA